MGTFANYENSRKKLKATPVPYKFISLLGEPKQVLATPHNTEARTHSIVFLRPIGLLKWGPLTGGR